MRLTAADNCKCRFFDRQNRPENGAVLLLQSEIVIVIVVIVILVLIIILVVLILIIVLIVLVLVLIVLVILVLIIVIHYNHPAFKLYCLQRRGEIYYILNNFSVFFLAELSTLSTEVFLISAIFFAVK